MPRRTELANDKHIERRTQSRGDLPRDRHPATWQSQDQDVRAAGVRAQCVRQGLAGFTPVAVYPG